MGNSQSKRKISIILIDNIFKVEIKDNSAIYFQTIEELKEIPFKNKQKAAIVQMKEESSSTFTEVQIIQFCYLNEVEKLPRVRNESYLSLNQALYYRSTL